MPRVRRRTGYSLSGTSSCASTSKNRTGIVAGALAGSMACGGSMCSRVGCRWCARCTPPPVCIHCGGHTPTVGGSVFCFSVQTRITEWACIDPTCLGRDDITVYQFLVGGYERRG